MKKFLALLVAVMVLAASLSALAAPTTNNTLTINDSRTNRTYTAYQILIGDISGSEGATGAAGFTLANIAWGSAVAATGELSATELAALPGYDADRTTIEDYINSLGELSGGISIPWDATAQKYVKDGLTSGWYYVVDSTDVDGTDDYQSAFLTEVVGSATATPKGSKTTVEKKVDDINDTTEVSEPTQDSADHDIGDTITFTLTATLGSDLTDYDVYELIFVDNLSKGLTYGEVTSLKIDGTTKDIENVVVSNGTWQGSSTAYAEGTTKNFRIADVLDLGAEAGDTVEIKYTATLNEYAQTGTPGNPNKVYLEYTNNPDHTSHGKTGEDVNKVFTYKVDVNKVTGAARTALTGANFTLYKQVPEGTEDAQTGAAIKATYTNDSIKADALVDANYYLTVGNKTGDATGATFEFKGIDDGTYVLVETTIPDGYNAWDAVEFEVEATHDEEADDPQLTELTGGDLFEDPNGSVTLDTGALETNVVNNSGVQLPSTGGIGTTIFYVGGSILVLAAVILLVTKRRMNAEK